MKEIWKYIEGYENYQISNLGNVKSLNYNGTGKERILKNNILNKKYCGVTISIKGKKKFFYIHRLVGQAFLGLDINNKDICVCHKSEKLDENGLLNNSIKNLFLGTYKENSVDMSNKGRSGMQGKFGKLHHNSKKINQYDLDGKFIKTWDSGMDIKRGLGIQIQGVCYCCKGKYKFSQGFKWKYKII